MFPFFNHYPGTDLHEIDLAYILKLCAELRASNTTLEQWAALHKTEYAELENKVDGIIGHLQDIIVPWDSSIAYRIYSIVEYQGTNYIAIQDVPVGAMITNTDYWQPADTTIQQINVISLSVSEMKRTRRYYTIDEAGAVGDGVTDDTAAIEAALAYCAQTGLLCSTLGKTYKITSDIDVAAKFDVNHATILSENKVITIQPDGGLLNASLDNTRLVIGSAEGDRIVYNIWFYDWTGDAFTIDGAGSHIYDQFHFTRTRDIEAGTHPRCIVINSADVSLSHAEGDGGLTGLVLNSANAKVFDTQLWLNNYTGKDGSIFCEIHGTANELVGCCSDTYETVIKSDGYRATTLVGFTVINNNVQFNNRTMTFLDMPSGQWLLHGDVMVRMTGFETRNIIFALGSENADLKFTFIDGSPSPLVAMANVTVQSHSNTAGVTYRSSRMEYIDDRVKIDLNFTVSGSTNNVKLRVDDLYCYSRIPTTAIGCYVVTANGVEAGNFVRSGTEIVISSKSGNNITSGSVSFSFART